MMKNSNKGFTLMELVVAISIFGIVSVFLASFLAPQIAIFNKLQKKVQATAACDTLYNTIQNDVQYAKYYKLYDEKNEEIIGDSGQPISNSNKLAFNILSENGNKPDATTTIDGKSIASTTNAKYKYSGTTTVKFTLNYSKKALDALSQGKATERDLLILEITVSDGKEDFYATTRIINLVDANMPIMLSNTTNNSADPAEQNTNLSNNTLVEQNIDQSNTASPTNGMVNPLSTQPVAQ